MTETTPSSRPTKSQAVPNLAKLAEAERKERKERKSDLPASLRVKEAASKDDPLDGVPFTD